MDGVRVVEQRPLLALPIGGSGGTKHLVVADLSTLKINNKVIVELDNWGARPNPYAYYSDFKARPRHWLTDREYYETNAKYMQRMGTRIASRRGPCSTAQCTRTTTPKRASR